jgi:hypothetical protein
MYDIKQRKQVKKETTIKYIEAFMEWIHACMAGVCLIFYIHY